MLRKGNQRGDAGLMKKFAMVLVLIWRISVYSGDTGRMTFTAMAEPTFSHDGRWVHFTDRCGEEIEISGSSTIIIRKTEE